MWAVGTICLTKNVSGPLALCHNMMLLINYRNQKAGVKSILRLARYKTSTFTWVTQLGGGDVTPNPLPGNSAASEGFAGNSPSSGDFAGKLVRGRRWFTSFRKFSLESRPGGCRNAPTRTWRFRKFKGGGSRLPRAGQCLIHPYCFRGNAPLYIIIV